MKKIILILSLCFLAVLNCNAQMSIIDDGWYRATVKYTNYSTYTFATYTLKVKVRYEKVVQIDFGNGGSVHNGINNEGYMYSGGTLYPEKDYYGNLLSVEGSVNIYESDGSVRNFKIKIE